MKWNQKEQIKLISVKKYQQEIRELSKGGIPIEIPTNIAINIYL